MVVFHFDGEDGPVAPQRLHAAQKNVSLGSLHVKMGKGEALVRYATDSLPTKLLVREYLTALPDEKILAAELRKTRTKLEKRR
jgi:hypothetical protein